MAAKQEAFILVPNNYVPSDGTPDAPRFRWVRRSPLPPLPEEESKARRDAQVEQVLQDPLQQAIAEYKRGLQTPESVTAYWRAKFQVDGSRVGVDISVPDCDWTEEEIQRPMVDVRGNSIQGMMVYKPAEITGKEGLILLGKMFPQLGSYSVQKDTPITDDHDITGWIKVEAPLDRKGVPVTPNLNTTQEDLENHAKDHGYMGQREGTYILASQASQDSTGYYLDENSYSRLLGSRDEGYVASAHFSPDGRVYVDWGLDPQGRDRDIGGRFEEVKKLKS